MKKYTVVFKDIKTGKVLHMFPPESKEEAQARYDNFIISNTHLFEKEIIEAQ
jgi:hypothetical protein